MAGSSLIVVGALLGATAFLMNFSLHKIDEGNGAHSHNSYYYNSIIVVFYIIIFIL